MDTIVITGWKPGLNKVALTRMLQSYGHGISAAKVLVDAVLGGGTVRFSVHHLDREIILARLVEMGAVAHATIGDLQ